MRRRRCDGHDDGDAAMAQNRVTLNVCPEPALPRAALPKCCHQKRLSTETLPAKCCHRNVATQMLPPKCCLLSPKVAASSLCFHASSFTLASTSLSLQALTLGAYGRMNISSGNGDEDGDKTRGEDRGEERDAATRERRRCGDDTERRRDDAATTTLRRRSHIELVELGFPVPVLQQA